jgi:alanine racemase
MDKNVHGDQGEGEQGAFPDEDMDEKIRPLWAEINLDNILYNVRNIKRLVGKSRLIAIVKADAYGHGAPFVASTMVEAGADAFGVAVVTEALQLREYGIAEPILVLSYTPPAFFMDALREDLVLNCLSFEDAEKLSETAGNLGTKAKVLISLDTGIGRVGFQPDDEGIAEIVRISRLPNILMDSIYTHFASADFKDKAVTVNQLRKYDQAMKMLRDAGVTFTHEHVANSAAIVDMKETYLESVRPGIILYGYHPSQEVLKERLSLKPVMTVKGRIIQLKTVPKGTGISYGHRFVTDREETKIATIPIGYADGYFRGLSGKASVIVGGKLCPQVGSVCMDHIMVDVTEVEGVRVLDEAILLGRDKEVSFDAQDMADILGTIPYEILCAVSKRVPRVYMKDGKEVLRKSYV